MGLGSQLPGSVTSSIGHGLGFRWQKQTKIKREVFRQNHQVRLEEKRTKISRNLEGDLPATIIPDEQLRFILESVLQYAIASVPLDGGLDILTRFCVPRNEIRDGQPFFVKTGNFIEVLVAFTYSKKPEGKATSQQEGAPDFVLRLVDDIVRSNRGMIKFGSNETKGKRFISLKSPVERRKAVR